VNLAPCTAGKKSAGALAEGKKMLCMFPNMPPPWHFTTWLDLFDHWQTLATGFLALAAALIAVGVALRKDRREVRAMRLSLAVEIRRLINIMLQTHAIFDLTSRSNKALPADDVVKEISRGVPVVFPAMADRVGLLGFRLAPYVLTFYANLKQIEHAGRTAANPAGYVEPADQTALMKLIEDACRQNVLPLLSKLPRDKSDTEFKVKIEAMGYSAARLQPASEDIWARKKD
jgi:hypothetical protein